jgi:hypothetical protein
MWSYKSTNHCYISQKPVTLKLCSLSGSPESGYFDILEALILHCSVFCDYIFETFRPNWSVHSIIYCDKISLPTSRSVAWTLVTKLPIWTASGSMNRNEGMRNIYHHKMFPYIV